ARVMCSPSAGRAAFSPAAARGASGRLRGSMRTWSPISLRSFRQNARYSLERLRKATCKAIIPSTKPIPIFNQLSFSTETLPTGMSDSKALLGHLRHIALGRNADDRVWGSHAQGREAGRTAG